MSSAMERGPRLRRAACVLGALFAFVACLAGAPWAASEFSTLGSAAAYAEVNGYSMTPSTDLVDGQSITVSRESNFFHVALYECNSDVTYDAPGPFSNPGCVYLGSMWSLGSYSATATFTLKSGVLDCSRGCNVLVIGTDGPIGLGGVAVVTVAVLPISPVPVVVPDAASVLEGDADSQMLNVPVSLSVASSLPVSVEWATGDATATTTSDYVAASGTTTFSPGETIKYVPIAVNGDTRIEPNEYFALGFSNATNATIGGFYGLGFGVITDDDVGAVTTNYTLAEQPRVLQSAAYLDQSAEQLQKTGIELVAHLLATSDPPPAPAPLASPPSSTGPVAYTTVWSASDVAALRSVEAQYFVTAEQAQKFGVQLMNYLLAIGGH